MGTPTSSNSLSNLFSLPENLPQGAPFHKLLSEKINELIIHHFEELIRILYRLDIDEKKLKEILATNIDEDAGVLIAEMVIEREQKKAETRKLFKKSGDAGDDERW